MVFSVSGLRPSVQHLYAKLNHFMKNDVYPIEDDLYAVKEGDNKWTVNPKLLELKVYCTRYFIPQIAFIVSILIYLSYFKGESKVRRIMELVYSGGNRP